MNKTQITMLMAAALHFNVAAQDEQFQDMSDPLAVYTQLGGGITDKGLNLKIGQTYDTGSETNMAMNIIEVKGVGGEWLGIRDDNNALYQGVDNAIDSLRFRNFQVETTNGRGTQVDINVNLDKESMDASYSLIQALPKWGPVQLYPLAGVGVTMQNDAENGYEVPGAFSALGFYGKVTVSENVWINYNPLWLTTISGSDEYKYGYYGNESNILTHEFAISYQISSRANIRYFANWNEKVNASDGDHRIEFNYQL
ncbi:hypothetical protein [Thalassotalea sp. PLHSN55]|uniref:hypothetical protein n=1 Tax=Thalassotalea sp. PLHSN55 TaxID=3435888 RepID=UPI003F8637EE